MRQRARWIAALSLSVLSLATLAAPATGEPRPRTASISHDFEGLSDGSYTPPDSTGAIGPTRYVELVNARFGIYDRATDALLSSGTLHELVGEAPSADMTDPQIIWDPGTDRFYYAALNASCNATVTDCLLDVGFSKTPSPSSAADWCTYDVSYGPDLLPDYPKLGDSADFLLIGANTFDTATGSYQGSDVTWLSKPPAGEACPDTFRSGTASALKNADGSLAFTPVPANQIDSSGAGWIVAIPASTASELTLFPVTRNPDGSASIPTTGTSVPVPAYSAPPAAPQAGTSFVLDTMDSRLTQAVSAIDPSRGGVAIWTQHTVAGGAGSAVRWYEINPSGGAPFQSGTVSDPSLYVFNGAISPDRAVSGAGQAFGDSMVLGFNTSSSSVFPAIQMVSKMGSESQSAFQLINQSTGPNVDSSCPAGPSCRWGDYSGATPDPAASLTRTHGTVWLTNQWNVPSASDADVDWRTWNWAVDLPDPALLQLSAATYSVAETDGSATIAVSRSGPTSNPVGVTYSTADGTAVAPGDYTSTTGTLTFAAGETIKSFQIPIIDDAATEPNETVSIQLGSPTGEAQLRSPTSATLTIFDDESDTTPPTDPTTLSSPSHTTRAWSRDRTADVSWSGGADSGSGVDGYSYEWSTDPATVPDAIKDAEETATGAVSPSLADGRSHWFHLRTRDNAGNWTSTVHLGPFWIDATAPGTPTITGAAFSSPFRTATTFGVGWTATDATSGVASYDVRYQRAKYNGGFGSYATWKSATTATTGSFPGAAGYTYQFLVRARDLAGNLTAFGPVRSLALPADDRAMSRSGSWSLATNSAYYLSTISRASARGASLSLAVSAKRLALVATKCPGCGTVEVYLGSTLLRRISLSASSTLHKQVIAITTFSSVRSGTARIRVYSSGKQVRIDGLGVSRA